MSDEKLQQAKDQVSRLYDQCVEEINSGEEYVNVDQCVGSMRVLEELARTLGVAIKARAISRVVVETTFKFLRDKKVDLRLTDQDSIDLTDVIEKVLKKNGV